MCQKISRTLNQMMIARSFLKQNLCNVWPLSPEQDEADGITKIDGNFICMRCGYKTTIKYHARRHYQTKHLPQKPATCHICQKEFKNPIYRDHHRSQTHGITKRMMKEAAKKSKIPLAPSLSHMKVNKNMKE